MTQSEEEPKDFREAQILDISQMTDQQKVHLVTYYLGELADYYKFAAEQMGVDTNRLLRPLKRQLWRKEQEVLQLRMHVVQVLEWRIGKRLGDELSRAQSSNVVHPSADLLEDRRKDTEILEVIQRGLGILVKRWEHKYSQQYKVLKAMLGLMEVVWGVVRNVDEG